jgi:hypothetical protein
MSEPFFIIVKEKTDATQSSLMHEAVKEHAATWWHQWEDLWIVEGGGPAQAWRERLRVFVPAGVAGALLIFELPRDTADRKWSAMAKPAHWQWLQQHYSLATGGDPIPKQDTPKLPPAKS